MSIDLQQFHQVFFEESLEGLDAMEDGLLQISEDNPPDAELINTIFRAAHSIKGGSGTFGFTEISEFTHVLETLLDEVRDGLRTLDNVSVELLLKSCDCLRNMVVVLQNGEEIDNSTAKPLVEAFEAMLANGAAPAAQPEANEAPVVAPSTAPSVAPSTNTSNEPVATNSPQDIVASSFDMLLGGNEEAASEGVEGEQQSPQWKIHFVPEPQILLTGNEPLRIFRELAGLGELRVEAQTEQVPGLEELTVDECFIAWELFLTSDASKEDILEVFDWVIDDCQLTVELLPVEGQTQNSTEPTAAVQTKAAVPEQVAPEAEIPQPVTAEPAAAPVPAPAVQAAPAAAKPVAKAAGDAPKAAQSSASSSIRVGIDKVDSLINLVGELVITQSMLSELGSDFDMSKLDRLANGLEQLVQHTRELQESVMQIRMLPISYAFNRFPRMIRDLSSKTGKKIELKLIGENTELDKTVMEQISDPLVHLVRNAADHGVEMPEERVAAGKSETGTIHLEAYHKGGNIVVEIRDDGRGIDPEKILAKAIERGVVENDQQLTDQEIYELIFEPGFSTAETVSDISGRGVGMDVVRRNIHNLGGRVEIDSQLGQGSVFRVHLPLTLAILDGQLVRIGDQTYIIPLVAIVESLQIKTELVNHVSGNMVLYRLREDNVPIIPVHQEFNLQADKTDLNDALLVVVEGDGQKVGLLVDDLLAQQQVVIKSLETNFRRVEGLSGATILGDGSVAMILDVPGLISRVSRRARRSQRNRAA